MTRPITTFRNRFLVVVHDPARGGAVDPVTGERIVPLSEFLRMLHAQRAAHAKTGEPYTITQRLTAAEETTDAS